MLIKYPEAQDRKQKVYRAVNYAVECGAEKKDVSVVLDVDRQFASFLKDVGQEWGAEVEVFDTPAQDTQGLHRKIDLQAKILLWLVRNERSHLLQAIESLGLTKEEMEAALR